MHENRYSNHIIEQIRAVLTARKHSELPSGPVPSAVLLPLFLKGGELHMLLTKRSAHLTHHAGEISFPGGVSDHGEHPRDTALRETWEEIGINPEHVDILGSLDEVYSIHHYKVSPYVGFISGNLTLKLNRAEIDTALEVPVSHLLNPSCLKIEEWGWKGRNYPVYFYRHQDEDIWGMTGEIVRNFLEVVFRGDTIPTNVSQHPDNR